MTEGIDGKSSRSNPDLSTSAEKSAMPSSPGDTPEAIQARKLAAVMKIKNAILASKAILFMNLRSYFSKRFAEPWKVVQKALRWNVLFLIDAHAVLFPLALLSGFHLKGQVKRACFKRYAYDFDLKVGLQAGIKLRKKGWISDGKVQKGLIIPKSLLHPQLSSILEGKVWPQLGQKLC